MRLFVGIDVGDSERIALAALMAALRQRVATLDPAARVTWVSPERLHVTVRFIGDVDEAAATDVARALEPALSAPPFHVEFKGVGVFPPTGRPRVLWAGVGRGGENLVALEQEVSARLVACGLSLDEKTYHPHVTLARIKDAMRLRSAALLRDLRQPECGRMLVDAITLFESRMSPRGVAYRPLLRTALTKPD